MMCYAQKHEEETEGMSHQNEKPIIQFFIHIFKAQTENVTWRPAVPHTLKDQIE